MLITGAVDGRPGNMASMRLYVAPFLLAVLIGCSKNSGLAGLKDTLQRPPDLPAQHYDVAATDGFSPEFKREHNIGPESTWAGYSKPFSVDIPPSVALPKGDWTGFGNGGFATTSGGRVSFLVLKPVDYVLEGIVPSRELAKQKEALIAQCESSIPSDAIVANGWVGRPMGAAISGKTHTSCRYLFFSEREFLQISLRWDNGNSTQESEARQAMAYGLWSVKIK